MFETVQGFNLIIYLAETHHVGQMDSLDHFIELKILGPDDDLLLRVKNWLHHIFSSSRVAETFFMKSTEADIVNEIDYSRLRLFFKELYHHVIVNTYLKFPDVKESVLSSVQSLLNFIGGGVELVRESNVNLFLVVLEVNF